jgi:hypothetical protein
MKINWKKTGISGKIEDNVKAGYEQITAISKARPRSSIG